MSGALPESSAYLPVPDAPAGRPLRLGLVSDTHGVLCYEVLQRLQGSDLIVHAGDVGHHGGATGVLRQLAAVAPVYAVRGNVDEADSDNGGEDEGHDEGPVVNSEHGSAGAGVGALRDAPDGAVALAGGGGGGRDSGGAGRLGSPRALPSHRLLEAAGWRILLTHIVGQPPQAVDPAAAELIRQHQPHIVIFGHSHKHAAITANGRRYYNPGSAGPARFKLPRTAAMLELPPRSGHAGGSADAAVGPGPEPVFTLIHLAPKAPPRPASAAKKPQPRPRPDHSRAAAAAAGPALHSDTDAAVLRAEAQQQLVQEAAMEAARDAGPPRRPADKGDAVALGGVSAGEGMPTLDGGASGGASGMGQASAGAVGRVGEGPEGDVWAEPGCAGSRPPRRRGRKGGVGDGDGAAGPQAQARQGSSCKRRKAGATP